MLYSPLFFFYVKRARLGPNSGPGPKIPGPALASGPTRAQDSWSSTFFGPKLGPRLGLTRARLEKRKTNKVFFYWYYNFGLTGNKLNVFSKCKVETSDTFVCFPVGPETTQNEVGKVCWRHTNNFQVKNKNFELESSSHSPRLPKKRIPGLGPFRAQGKNSRPELAPR